MTTQLWDVEAEISKLQQEVKSLLEDNDNKLKQPLLEPWECEILRRMGDALSNLLYVAHEEAEFPTSDKKVLHNDVQAISDESGVNEVLCRRGATRADSPLHFFVCLLRQRKL